MTLRIGRPGHGYPPTGGQLSTEQVNDVLDSAAKHATQDAREFRITRVNRAWEKTFDGFKPITVFHVETEYDSE